MNGRAVVIDKNRGVCPCPHKKAFATKGAAKHYRDKHNHATPLVGDGLRIYHCKCGLYHYTSMSRQIQKNPKVKHGQPGLKNAEAFATYLKRKQND